MKVDETTALSEVLREYQEDSTNDQAQARLAIALTRVVENNVRRTLIKKLRPQDVDDVCSEIILGFWKFRHSVRPDECPKLINTLKYRRTTDQVREYYREQDHRTYEPAKDERDLLALLPARDAKPGTEASQDVWELLYDLKLSDQDHLVAYTLHLGIDKQVIGKLLGMSSNAVTRSIKRCREVLEGVSREVDAEEPDRLDGQPVRYKQLRQLLNDPARREEYCDLAEELTQRESARYSAAMLDRAGFYGDLVARESKRLSGQEQLDALSILNEQFPRVVDAIEHAMSLDDSACLAKFAASIVSLLHMQGKLELGASLFNRLLQQANKAGNRSLEVQAARYYGKFMTQAGKLERAYEITFHALRLALLEEDEAELAKVQIALGDITRYQGRYGESIDYYTLALERGRKLLDKYLISGALCSLGLIALRQRRMDEAKMHFTESLEIARETGNIYRIAGDLHNLACVGVNQGDYDEAQRLTQEALELNRLIGNRTFEVRNLIQLGKIALDQERLEDAGQFFSNAELIAAETGNELDYIFGSDDLPSADAATGDSEDTRWHSERAIQVDRMSPDCSCDWR